MIEIYIYLSIGGIYFLLGLIGFFVKKLINTIDTLKSAINEIKIEGGIQKTEINHLKYLLYDIKSKNS